MGCCDYGMRTHCCRRARCAQIVVLDFYGNDGAIDGLVGDREPANDGEASGLDKESENTKK